MAQATVSTREMLSKAGQLEELNQRFMASVRQLETLEAALSGMWEGEANTAFRNAFNNDKIQMTNFYNAIAIYVQRLKEIAVRYQDTEARNVEMAATRNYN